MNKKRFFALSVAAATFGIIGMTSVALAIPTSSHSGGANANQIGVVRIDPNDPSVAYVTGRYTCPASSDPAHLFVSVKQVAGGKPNSGPQRRGQQRTHVSRTAAGWSATPDPTSSPATARGTPAPGRSPRTSVPTRTVKVVPSFPARSTCSSAGTARRLVARV